MVIYYSLASKASIKQNKNETNRYACYLETYCVVDRQYAFLAERKKHCPCINVSKAFGHLTFHVEWFNISPRSMHVCVYSCVSQHLAEKNVVIYYSLRSKASIKQTNRNQSVSLLPRNVQCDRPEEVGHAPNCIMVEVINQSWACIFLQVDLEGIATRGMKRFSFRAFSVLTSLVIQLP